MILVSSLGYAQQNQTTRASRGAPQ